MSIRTAALVCLAQGPPAIGEAPPPTAPQPAPGANRSLKPMLPLLMVLTLGIVLLLASFGTSWYSISQNVSSGGGGYTVQVQGRTDYSLSGVNTAVNTNVPLIGQTTIINTKSWSEYENDYRNSTDKDPKLPGVYSAAAALAGIGAAFTFLAVIVVFLGWLGKAPAKLVRLTWLFLLLGAVTSFATIGAFAATHPAAYDEDMNNPAYAHPGPHQSFWGSETHNYDAYNSTQSTWGPGIGWGLVIAAGAFQLGAVLLLRRSPFGLALPRPLAPALQPAIGEVTPVATAAPGYVPAPPPPFRKLMANRTMLLALVVGIVVIVAAAGALSLGGGALGGGSRPAPAAAKLQEKEGTLSVTSALVPEGQTLEFPIMFMTAGDNASAVTNIFEVSVSVSWTDSMSESRPDGMTFSLRSPDGQTDTEKTEGMSGSATLVIKTNVSDTKVEDNSEGWTFAATCDYAGDDPVGPFGFLVYVDPGNDYTATAEYKYYGNPSK